MAKWDQFETRPSLFFLALSLPPDGKACQWPGIKLPLHKLIVIRTSVRLPPQTLNRDQALLLVKPVANGPWKRKGNSRSVLGFKHSLWPHACFHTWITLQVVFSGLHRFHNAMVRPFWQTESNECESPVDGGWIPVVATGPQVWHPAREVPILFLVYINDLPRSITSECSIFADDTSIFKTGRNSQLLSSRISEDLSRATDWATVWGMQFNAEKSEHLFISTKRNNTSKQRVLMDNTQIPQVTSHKHLGIHFSDTLSCQRLIDKVYTSCAHRVGMIRRLRWRFSPAVLKNIFIGAVQPKLEYACAVWSGGSTQKLQKLCTSLFRRNGLALQPLHAARIDRQSHTFEWGDGPMQYIVREGKHKTSKLAFLFTEKNFASTFYTLHTSLTTL